MQGHRTTIRGVAGTAVVTALAVSLGAAAAHAAPATTPEGGRSTETFVMNFLTKDGVDRPTRVTASGPISGSGVETQTTQGTPDGETVRFVWHFPGGTVTADAVEQYSLAPDYRSCTAKATGVGTWTIVGGTGAYAGATGSGTFEDRGSFVGARDAHGACDPEAEPSLSVFTLRGAGSASLGGSQPAASS